MTVCSLVAILLLTLARSAARSPRFAIAVVLAFGVTFTYPLLDAHMRRRSPGDLAALHRMQVFLTRSLITPMMVVVLAAGLYPALDRWELGDGWISATLVILIVLFALVGGVFTPLEKRLALLARRAMRGRALRAAPNTSSRPRSSPCSAAWPAC